MPTIFEQLDDALAGNQLDTIMAGEAENLTGVVSTVANLISNPPDEFGAFVQRIAEATQGPGRP